MSSSNNQASQNGHQTERQTQTTTKLKLIIDSNSKKSMPVQTKTARKHLHMATVDIRRLDGTHLFHFIPKLQQQMSSKSKQPLALLLLAIVVCQLMLAPVARASVLTSASNPNSRFAATAPISSPSNLSQLHELARHASNLPSVVALVNANHHGSHHHATNPTLPTSPAPQQSTQSLLPTSNPSTAKYPTNLVRLGNSTTRSIQHGDHVSPIGRGQTTSDISVSHRQSSTSLLPINSDSSHRQHKPSFEKTCIGTSQRMSALVNKTEHYHSLAERYRNCTYVIGNLEITWLEKGQNGKLHDLSFLENIREITGYLLIAYVSVEKIRMPNLQIIRGRDLFKLNNGQNEEYAMYLIENELKNLELPNLREIITGSIGSYHNRNLCHLNQISWEEILNPPYKSVLIYNGTLPECPPCDQACNGNHCWGEGPDKCQKFSKINCPDQCSSGRCFGGGPRECCHMFCAGGCTGPKQTDCLACKNFYDDGECIQECPSMQKYNPSKFIWEADPKGKYAFGATCVKECPEHLLRDNGACVRNCPPNKRSLNNECVPCAGPCPKNCQGVDIVHSGNIDQFVNCTQIEGSLTILDTTFDGFSEMTPNNTLGVRYKPLHPSRLDVFKNIKEITGFLSVQASHPDFKNLSCFKNLKVIGGRQTTETNHVVSILKTSLVSLGLHSLQKVRSGKIVLQGNKDLCFIDSMDWTYLNLTKPGLITALDNANATECYQADLVCHSQCTKHGCWGPNSDECLSCTNYKLDDYCVENCSATQSIGFLSFDFGNKTCKKCHSECRGGCYGSEAQDCFKCKNVRDGPHCVAECPIHKYSNNGVCQECDKSCLDGCTGPSNKLGEGGCKTCSKTVILNHPINSNTSSSSYCVKAEENCPEGFYQEYASPQSDGPLKSWIGKPICRKCHHRCKGCTGMGTHVSVCECAKYVVGEQCEDSCPRDYYADEQARQCNKCSLECNGCFGPTEADCVACRVYRIYSDSYTPLAASQVTTAMSFKEEGFEIHQEQIRFNCTAQCPPEKPHRISDANMLDPYCSDIADINLENSRLSYTSIMFIFMLIFSSVGVCFAIYRRPTKEEYNDKSVAELTMQLSGLPNDIEPVNQSNMKPNLNPLRSIKETELRKGNILGSGFGGTVYLGAWYPEGREHKKPIPVAIKILRENSDSNMNKELLDEAYIMAKVNHDNLIPLLAICATPNYFMLITPLMPLGCLLEYVKLHKNEIGSKNLLEWCKQIAKGMAYLEEERMVHRDLALRNVLLRTSGRAMISDFGLAKFLDDQSEYHSGGGRLPIKWLAPECIRERKFTHKSDVWAFGVTVWELLTFGMKPFEDYDTKDVPLAIERGARLHQPSNMSAEVYKVMYACWFYNPDSRPNFRSILVNFVSFARDPERYLICASKGIDYNKIREPGRNSDSDGNAFEDCASELNSYSEEEAHTRNLLNDLMSNNHNTHNNEFMSFEMRHHSESESVGHGQHPLTPTTKRLGMFESSRQQLIGEEVFSLESHNHGASKSLADSNNNNCTFVNNNNNEHLINPDSCWSSHHTVSTNSLGQRSEQPTDFDDYLLPSPSTNGKSGSNFLFP